MVEDSTKEWFDEVEVIISEPLKFKAKLAIGEDAFTSLRVKNATKEIWNTSIVGAVGAGVTAVITSPPAWLFFASSPVGWIVGAGIAASGSWVGLTRYLKSKSNSRVTVIPDFINTPLDVISLTLFDLMAPLAIKLAISDEDFSKSERQIISDYFINEWGYDESFVQNGLEYIENNINGFEIEALAKALAQYKKSNRDCNYLVMTQDLIQFLTEVSIADRKIDSREEEIVSMIENIFSETDKSKVRKYSEGIIMDVKGKFTRVGDVLPFSGRKNIYSAED